MENSSEWTEGSMRGWIEGGGRKGERPILPPEWWWVVITGHYTEPGMARNELDLIWVSKENGKEKNYRLMQR